jgi:hypothetical protein
MKIRPVGAELFRADGRTYRQADMMKLIVAFRNFANAPKKLLPLSRTEPQFLGCPARILITVPNTLSRPC